MSSSPEDKYESYIGNKLRMGSSTAYDSLPSLFGCFKCVVESVLVFRHYECTLEVDKAQHLHKEHNSIFSAWSDIRDIHDMWMGTEDTHI